MSAASAPTLIRSGGGATIVIRRNVSSGVNTAAASLVPANESNSAASSASTQQPIINTTTLDRPHSQSISHKSSATLNGEGATLNKRTSSSSSAAVATAASSTISPPPAQLEFQTGADQIVASRTGPLPHNTYFSSDQNMRPDPPASRPVVTLPPCCTGAVDLKIPELITGHISNVTLPSRLSLLGRTSYETFAAMRPINLGNSVLGFAPVWSKKHFVRTDLFVLPSIFSKGGARIYVFLRILLFLVFLVFFFQFAQVWNLNIGRAWFFGSSIAIYVMYQLAQIRRAPDGVMAFCRSMGAPEIEEFMFSYAWKVEPDAIRTLAKAMYNNGIGVWLDVVKLCPGDEIRPMVRTMMNRVFRCVVFLSPAYVASPNCCVEFYEAVQWPEKLLICILEPVPALSEFLTMLESRGAIIIHGGMKPLIAQLDDEICDVNNSAAFKWWRRQKISGSAGVPSNTSCVPTYWYTIPRFSLTGRIGIPSRSLSVGPIYLTGDCKQAGQRFYPPYLFLLAIIAVVSNFVDIYYTFRNSSCETITYPDGRTVYVEDETHCHGWIDYAWLALIALCNIAPFTVTTSLFETRTNPHPCLRPLLASKSMHGGIKIRVEGKQEDGMVQALNAFLTNIGHNARDVNRRGKGEKSEVVSQHGKQVADASTLDIVPTGATAITIFPASGATNHNTNMIGRSNSDEPGMTPLLSGGVEAPSPQPVSPQPISPQPSASVNTTPTAWTSPASRRGSMNGTTAILRKDLSRLAISDAPRQRLPLSHEEGLAAGFRTYITVYIMSDFAQRDALFSSDTFPFDPRTSLFVWNNTERDPFTKDEIGERLMRFLVLVAGWEKNLLAENLFSAIGVRVVDMLHSAELPDEMTSLLPASPPLEGDRVVPMHTD